MRETDKHFLISLVFALGIILFWRGVWHIADITPILRNEFVSFFIGLLILTLSGLIYHEFDPFAKHLTRTSKAIHDAVVDAKREGGYFLRYYDSKLKKQVRMPAHHVKHIEQNVLVVHEGNRESFIPVHRVTRVEKGKKVIWMR